MGAERFIQAFSAILLAALVVQACGGQSLEHEDGGGDDGSAGSSGARGGTGGVAGDGGSFTGGTVSTGGISTGGISTGGISTGGISTGGISFGGSSAGGVAGTGGSAGAGGVCSLPIVTGPCDASIPSFGFSQSDGHCVPFIYGGCEGNENRFRTLVECEEACGGSLSSCPAKLPMADMCPVEGQICTYDFENCLCSVSGTYNCVKTDQSCNLASDPDVSPIVVAVYQKCTCTRGMWACNIVTYGGR